MSDEADPAWAAAQNMIDRYGAEAWAEAKKRVAELRGTPHAEAFALWVRIQDLLAPAESARPPRGRS